MPADFTAPPTGPTAATNPDTGDLATAIATVSESLQNLRAALADRIFGQERVITETLTALLAGGHVLLIGVPGLAKTRLVETLGRLLGLGAKRLQCTPDLMPADILGAEVLEESAEGKRAFRFIPGPVFCQLLMADEINRASPRTQSALLQAMQEQQVSVAGQTFPLPRPFHVLATQNPLEQEGTYPLPEAQLDRFLLQVDVSYPDRLSERHMLLATTTVEEAPPLPVLTPDAMLAAQALVRKMPMTDRLLDGILTLVRNGRPETTALPEIKQQVAWGPGPRASQALALAARARALLEGRLAPSLDDVVALAGPVLRHRMQMTFAARAEGVTLDAVIARLIESLD